ncbi:MAG: hypothetical protein ACRD1B_07740, partial [Thermoanaerobaculia bacterium]
DFTPPAELLAEVPSDFNAIVARAMAKDPWNRYRRGKDFGLALRQLCAHLEEQKALEDLGSMVSAAENMPTLRMDLAQLLPGAEPGATLVAPPADSPDFVPTQLLDLRAERAALASAGRRRTSEATRAIALPEPLPPPAEEPTPALSPESTNPAGRAPEEEGSEAAADGGGAEPEPVEDLPPPPSAPRPVRWPSMGASAAARSASEVIEKVRAWSQMLKLEVNTRWFYISAGAWAILMLLICGSIFVRSLVAARPTVVENAALARETQERKQALDEGRKLFNAGRYEESLVLFRRVLARSPNNQRARQYAQMSENALQGRLEEARKSSEVDRLLEAGWAAFGEGKFAEARQRADEALALDAGKIEAQGLKDDASTKIAELEAAAAAERKKKAKEVAAKRSTLPQPGPIRRPASAQAPGQAPVQSGATTVTLNLVFDSPISEGTVMVAVNDQIRLKVPFAFKRKVSIFKTVKETGTVRGTMTIEPGSVGIKVWLSGPDITTAYKNLTGTFSAGDTRTLRLEYAGEQLNLRIQ